MVGDAKTIRAFRLQAGEPFRPSEDSTHVGAIVLAFEPLAW
jgi:hypothetical protein